jgi:hypothetical protein
MRLGRKEKSACQDGRKMSFKVEVIADNSGEWVGNALRFPTKKAAEIYAKDLYSRWTAVKEWRVKPSKDPVGNEQYEDQKLGISERRPRYMTHAQERAEEKKVDLEFVNDFSRGDRVTVDPSWKRHWTFKEAPAPTKQLWSELFRQVGVVAATDTWGNVYVMDRYDQMHGRQGFPVPARFVKRAGPEIN